MEEILQKCSIESYNITLPNFYNSKWSHLFYFIDYFIDMAIGDALFKKIKLGDSIDTCDVMNKTVNDMKSTLVSAY